MCYLLTFTFVMVINNIGAIVKFCNPKCFSRMEILEVSISHLANGLIVI